MKVVLTGGGTAGHINPALAIGEQIKKDNSKNEILYIGNKGGMEETLVSEHGYKFESIEIRGLKRKLTPKNIAANIKTVFMAKRATRRTGDLIKQFKPDIVIGTGGYVSGPVVKKAQQMGIKTLIHEQNAYPGITTKLLAPKAEKVMLASMAAESRLKNTENVVYVGNPLRNDFMTADKETSKEKLGLKGKFVILSYGGSLGAKYINQAVCRMIKNLYKIENIVFIHGTGKVGYKETMDLYHSMNLYPDKIDNIRVLDYINNMPDYMAAADIVVSRAGAMTLSEIEALGKAAVLIPSPYVTENHQYWNAKELEDKNAAVLVEEKDLSSEKLEKEVVKLINNKAKIREMEQNSKKMAVLNCEDRILKIIRETLQK